MGTPERVELWTFAQPLPGRSGPAARRAEDEGWTGLAFTDSQNVTGEPYIALTVAAGVTSRLRLATGVTNPWTRHPAVTASAIACLDVESSGRAELGIGRGYSALALLGAGPAPVTALREYVELVRAYLRGETVPIERVTRAAGHRLGAEPSPEAATESGLRWLAEGFPDRPPVPVFAVASGPRVIRAAAESADRVTLAVGADPVRLRWAVKTAHEARPGVPIAAFVNVLVDEDTDRACRVSAGGIASFARFSGLHGRVGGPMPASHRAVMEAIPRHYAGAQTSLITPEFATDYAILGPPSYCVDRLAEIAALGIDRFHVVGPSHGVDDVDEEMARAYRDRFVTEVLPRLTI
jgi:5,10-methylenetetrahydromethanopterin reductase